MRGIELIVVLLAVSAALRLLARSLGVPHPILLVLAGIGLALIPQLPRIDVAPDALFLLFVPPLLYWGSLTTSLRDLRRQSAPIARYGTLVVLLTTAVVAVVAHWLTQEFTWAAAFVLGAIVSPPDPVAAIAVLRPLGVPRDIISILEGEGLVNDATALVCYQIAVGVVVTGTFSPERAAVRFVITGVGGVGIGIGVGWLVALVRQKLIGRFPIVENTVSLLTPFFAYLPAEWLGVSGVLSVVAGGLYLGRQGPRIVAPATRVQAESMWTMVQFLLESLVFILVGLELRDVVSSLQLHALRRLSGYALVIVLSLIIVRLVYTFSAVAFVRVWRRHRRQPSPSWREAAFVGWTGMRGGDSLVIALALPLTTAAGSRFPARDLIIFLTFAAILGTLVLQGFTLVPLLRLLKLRSNGEEDREEAHARHAAARAGLIRLNRISQGANVHPVALRDLRKKYEDHLRRWASRDGDQNEGQPPASDNERQATSYRGLRAEMIQAERDEVVTLRDQGRIGDDIMRRIQRDLDLEIMLLESAEDDAPETPYDLA
jgi:CPA1 family monovalent cation:H+ antiporter